MEFTFSKWNGLGNDFVIVDGAREKIKEDEYAETAVKVCDRHFGVGADGLVFLLPSEQADYRMRIFNPDGSEAEMCGNATRCIAKYAYENKFIQKTAFTLETGAGIIRPEILLRDGVYDTVRVDMGEPVLEGERIPVAGFGTSHIVGEALEVAGRTYRITCVSMGNPHCVIFVDDVEKVRLAEIGPLFETHARFPKKTNVEFVEVKDRSHMRMRVWERGAGVTLACGTGASATLVAAVLNGLTGRKADIKLDGGILTVEWKDDHHIYMSGPAEEVFRGIYVKE